jgi:membrane-bound lytic murein transglycosylase D
MTRLTLTVGMVAAMLVACRTGAPPQPKALPPRAEAGAQTTTHLATATPDPHDEVEALLTAAQDAVTQGDTSSFHDCEAAVFQILDRAPELGVGAGDCPTYRDDVVDELVRLADQAEDDEEGTEEPPPEPQPVPQEHVAELREKASLEKYDLPVLVNGEVTSLIDFYTGRYRERLIAALERASRYLPFIRTELKQANLPQDLAWLPLVESAFNPHARSRAKAQGLWQFMAGTARLYDLRSDSLVDERNDPFLATHAAVRHLSDLHGMFGSWELALAAYNCGAGNIQRALRRSKGNTDFWTLRRYLRRETRNYVPALWAVVVVTKDPAAYGLPQFEEKPVCLARVPVKGALDLEVLAERAGFDTEELASLNPALTRRLTPANASYQLAVPCGREPHVAEVIAAIPRSERVRQFLHVVKKGDTPGTIARRYGSTADAILAANGIKNARSLRIGQTLIVPRGPAQLSEHRKAAAVSPSPRDPASAQEKYVVRQGDTLFKIARRFGTSTEEIQKRNNLPDTTIRPGDVLVLSR